MKAEEVKSKIESAVPGVALKLVRESILVENANDIVKVVDYLKTASEFRLDYLSSLTGADYINFLEVVYHLYSMEKKTGPVVLRIRADRNNPKVPSLTPVYRGAEYQEREAYDMYGFIFENHPDPRRIFMWEGFEGYPMRKDYVQEDSETLESADIEWLEKNNIRVSEETRKAAQELKDKGQRATAPVPKPGA